MQVIAIDLGSNTIRVLKHDCTQNKRVAEYEKIVRTAEGLSTTGIIGKKAIANIIDGLLEAKEQIGFDTYKIKAVTTQALRVANNAKEVLETIKDKTGVEFEVINGEKEALLTLNAVKFRLEQLNINNNFVLIDIGGGSTEISYYLDGKVVSKSFPIGIVTVANRAKNLDDIYTIIDGESKEMAEFSVKYKNLDLQFVATAGTPTTIAAMKLGLAYETYDSNLINGVTLEYSEVDIYLKKLLNMSKQEREILVGVGRDDLIVAGIVIFKKLFEILKQKEVIVIDDGLREGVALSMCS